MMINSFKVKAFFCCIVAFASAFVDAAESVEGGGKEPVAASSTHTDTAYDKKSCEPGPHNVPNPFPEPDARAPDHFYFLLPTTSYLDNESKTEDAGVIVFEVNRTWAPIGVDRFYSLANDNYYDCAALFRVVPNFIVQWGIASNPEETEKWNAEIVDDPVLKSNTVGMVSFATAGPDTRTTQIFVNTADNYGLDDQGFAPFAKVVKGMHILTSNALNRPTPVPNQQTYRTEGNAWLLTDFPDTDIIKARPQPDGGATTTNIKYSLNDRNGGTSSDRDRDDEMSHQQPTKNDEHKDDVDATYDETDPNSAAALASMAIYSVMRVISFFLVACMQ